MSASINDGDTVRATVEGVVTTDAFGRRCMETAFGYFPSPPSAKRLKRRPYQVGDVIEKRKHVARLPVGSVVSNSYSRPIIVQHGGQLLADVGFTFAAAGRRRENGPYTVRYIPED